MSVRVSPRVGVMGAGAVGCYFGGMLARAGAEVTLVARPQHVEAIARDGLRLETLQFDERVRVRASTDVASASDAEIVLITVKTPDTESAAQALAPHLRSDALVVSAQNGVDNAPRLRRHLHQQVVPSAVYVSAAMVGPGHVKHIGQGGLIVGRGDGGGDAGQRIDALVTLFERANVPCRVSPNVDVDLWEKFTMNCAFNAISALTRMKYGPIAAGSLGRQVLEPLVHEVVSVAQASGVPLGDAEMLAAAYRVADAIPEATSSTAKDLARGKRTEIDELNGFVVRRGDELGVATPVNRTVHALVKAIEPGPSQ